MGLELSVIRENLDYLLWGRLAEGEPGGLVITLALSLGAGVIAVLGGLARPVFNAGTVVACQDARGDTLDVLLRREAADSSQ